MTTDLVAFLRAQFDEDELVARRVKAETDGTWAWTYRNVHAVDMSTGKTQHIATTDTGAQAVYVGLWNPDRVLTEVDAKRKIVDMYDHHTRCAREDSEAGSPSRAVETIRDTLHSVLLDLAQPYADRPGFREEWRP